MTIRVLVTSALALAVIPAAANAAITVIGNTSARLCYEAARADAPAARADRDHCDMALREEALTERDLVATHVNRGILRARSGDVRGALADFDEATALDPTEPEAYLNKGLVLATRASQPQQALPLFDRALELKTRRPELAYFGRGAAHEELGNIRLAYADYSSAQAAAPKWAVPRAELARFSVRR